MSSRHSYSRNCAGVTLSVPRERERRGAAVASRSGGLSAMIVSGGLVSVPLKVWTPASGRCCRRGRSARTSNVYRPSSTSGRCQPLWHDDEQQLGVDRLPRAPRARAPRSGRARRAGTRSASSDSRRHVVGAGEVEGHGLQAVLDRAGEVLGVGRRHVGRVDRAVVLERARVAAPFCGRATPRWSVSEQGSGPSRSPGCRACGSG